MVGVARGIDVVGRNRDEKRIKVVFG